MIAGFTHVSVAGHLASNAHNALLLRHVLTPPQGDQGTLATTLHLVLRASLLQGVAASLFRFTFCPAISYMAS